MGQIIVGRKKELAQIDQYYHSGKAEFIAVYGRRRVGKTYLIRQHFKNQFAFDMTGVMEGSKSEQMTAFHAALKTYGYKGKKNQNWIDAFFALRQLLESKIETGKRCVIFIDELPCLDTPKAGFVNALGHFWNNWANWQSEMMLIVCGSATSWMVRNVIDNHGGLHDRITHEMHLHPFTLGEAEEFFANNGFVWNRLSVVQAYMAIGGVPYYMSLFEKTDSPATGLDRLFFSGNAELKKAAVRHGLIDIDRVERFLYDPYGRRVHFVRWLEKPLKVEGYATNMMIPTKENPDWDVMNEKRRLWHHPQTNEERHDTFMDMYNQGLEIAKDVFRCFEQYLNNEISLEEALKMIGKKNFHTGLEEPDNMKYFDLVK